MNSKLDENVLAIADKIAEFFLSKNNGNVILAAKKVKQLKITEIIDTKDTTVIKTRAPGYFIGLKGEQILELQEYLGKKIHLIEEEENLYELAILNRIYNDDDPEESKDVNVLKDLYKDDEIYDYSWYEDDDSIPPPS